MNRYDEYITKKTNRGKREKNGENITLGEKVHVTPVFTKMANKNMGYLAKKPTFMS